MKRHGHLFTQIIDWVNLRSAFGKAKRGKRRRPDVARFEMAQERMLLTLQRRLDDSTYRPGQFHSFEITEPKRRLISAAPFEDRVVHHAVCNVVEPILDRQFISDSYACRKGKGSHAALRRSHQFAGKYSFVLRGDVKKFFPSIDHDVLMGILSSKFKDKRLLDLLRVIIEHSFPGQLSPSRLPGDDLFSLIGRRVGLPIGNQTSQLFGNVMLDPLDQYVKRRLGEKAWVRYADDFLLFGNNRRHLQETRNRICDFLVERRLKLHDRKTVVDRVANGFPYLGFRVSNGRLRLGKSAVKRFRRRLRKLENDYTAGAISAQSVMHSIMAWWGHAQHAHAMKLTRDIMSDFPFLKDVKQAEDIRKGKKNSRA